MKKKAPKHRWHVTADERKQIRRLTRAGMRQATIARIVGLTAPSVSKVQRILGLPTRVPTPEQEIVKLFANGWSGLKISKYLRCPANRVWAVRKKHGITRADGAGTQEPKGNIPGFVEALKRREDYIKTLAKKFGLGKCKANRIAHVVLATQEFRPGRCKPPLSSNFPQKHFTPRIAGGCAKLEGAA